MKHSYFYSKLIEDKQYISDDEMEYINYHSRRFLDTYKLCVKYLKKGDKVLSIGAGFGSIEKMLVQEQGVEVTIVDFPDTIADYKEVYDKNGIKSISADLTKDKLDLPHDHYDMLLQSEVIEHLPIPPAEQILKFKPYIKTGGLFVITTPNLGSILHIAQLLFMQPIMPTPEKMFSPVAVENQGVHRREYLPVEIHEAFNKVDFSDIHTSFFFYTYPKSLALKILYGIGAIIPRFRPGMFLIGKKNG